MRKEKKKRICITLSSEDLNELDELKSDTYSKTRSEAVGKLIREKTDNKLSK
jgi:metal-responsive CopG/Arc/MetJ family transcriptional regulator